MRMSSTGFKETFDTLEKELQKALTGYWTIAGTVLDKSSIQVLDPPPGYFSIEKNFFSSLFLYSYFRAGIKASRRTLYATVNQCLRGMVTGCDNILDDEYKMTLSTDLPEEASKFRSIIDIMVSDRVLFAILEKEIKKNQLTRSQVMEACFESLRTLTKSGSQEASEEKGVGKIISPEDVLGKIHPLKTGILFQSPWALPDLFETIDKHLASRIKKALFDIGMGCQLMDDMVDLDLDMQMNRHNYVASLIKYNGTKQETRRFDHIYSGKTDSVHLKDIFLKFPDSGKIAARKALELLKKGAQNLFARDHQFMVDTAVLVISKRIGADKYFNAFNIQ